MLHRNGRASAALPAGLPAGLLCVAVFCVAVFLALPTVAQSAKRQTGLQRVATLEDGHAHSSDHEWARWVVTNFAPTRIHYQMKRHKIFLRI